MAKVSLKERPARSVVTGVTLELTPREAVMLQTILRDIGGSPENNSPRSVIDGIRYELENANIPYIIARHIGGINLPDTLRFASEEDNALWGT